MFQKSITQRWNELNSVGEDQIENVQVPTQRETKFPPMTARIIGMIVAAVFLVIWLISNFASVDSPEPGGPRAPLADAQILQRLVIELDKARNEAIQFRDVGLITEYADQLSPVYGFDRKLIESMIKDDIVIQGLKYALLGVEQISLRRSGTSEFMRLNVRDTRSGYTQTIQGKSSMIPARIEGTWELELYRSVGSQKWTLWSAQRVRELQP